MKKKYTIAQLNEVNLSQFVEILGDIFEHSPWVAERSWYQRPFSSVSELHAVMVAEVVKASTEEQLGLLCAHPELAGHEAKAGDISKVSSEEQSGAKLDALSANEVVTIDELNASYKKTFGFPFIIAVRNHTTKSIFDEFYRRLTGDIESEKTIALEQVGLIAQFRLNDFIY